MLRWLVAQFGLVLAKDIPDYEDAAIAGYLADLDEDRRDNQAEKYECNKYETPA